MFRIKQLKSEHPYPTTVPAKQYIGQVGVLNPPFCQTHFQNGKVFSHFEIVTPPYIVGKFFPILKSLPPLTLWESFFPF